MSNDSAILEKCKKVIDHYGVGSCGPRGFYGSQKTHLDLEKKCSEFFGTEDCILYSFGFATVSSVIPAFCKRKDLVIVDEGCSYPIQHGSVLSRAQIIRYRHNDMDDLERILKEVNTGPMKKLQKKQRRYIITQGVFENSGDIAPLKRIVELKHKYKIRLLVDDSFGAGVLGKTGKGTVEHTGCDPLDIDILVINLENAFGGVGGVVLGSLPMVRHQRLMGLAFTFSAALPPYTSAGATYSIETLEKDATRLGILKSNIHHMHTLLKKHVTERALIRLDTQLDSPIFHIRLSPVESNEGRDGQKIFDAVAKRCLDRGVATVVPRYSNLEWTKVPYSLRLSVCAQHTKDQMEQAVDIVFEEIDMALS